MNNPLEMSDAKYAIIDSVVEGSKNSVNTSKDTNLSISLINVGDEIMCLFINNETGEILPQYAALGIEVKDIFDYMFNVLCNNV